jgi:hypothetical protein
MALTLLPDSLVIEASAVYPVTHAWKALDLGGGAFFYGLELLNGWRLRFPTPGNYTINGNLNGQVLPVAGVYVERRTSAAYATTAVGGSGPSATDIAAALLAAMNSDPPGVDVRRMNGAAVVGTGAPNDMWRGAA